MPALLFLMICITCGFIIAGKLADSFSASLNLVGLPLRWPILLPNYLFLFTIICGLMIFAEKRLTSRKRRLH